MTSDIEALEYFGGIHQVVHGYHSALSKRFPFCIYDEIQGDILTLADRLEALLGRKVDLVAADGIKENRRPFILSSLLPIAP